jgi:protocatechuate 3,4-dioxygenase beta subunit
MRRILPVLGVVLVTGVLLFVNSRTNNRISEKQSMNREEATVETPQRCSGQVIPSMTEGPYYKEGSPERTNIVNGAPGEKMVLSGHVYDQECNPVANVWIDFWQADGDGNYDNQGYTLRGHQFTDEEGKYILETVVPGEYPGRTPHIHLKIRANENSETITSQLFLPNVSQNSLDSIFDERLIMDVKETSQGEEATFNFVIQR